jgi:hypothetical protein
MFGFLNQNTKHHPKVMLTDADIKRLKTNHGVVLFFMNGCGHCVNMKDDWNAAVDECRNNGIGGDNDDFVLGAIESNDTDMFKENGISHNVSGYPTILYISSEDIQRGDMNHEKYEDPRKKDAFVKWIKDKKNKNKGKTREGKTREGKIEEVKIDMFNKNAFKTKNIGKQSGGGRSRRPRRKQPHKSKTKSKRHMKRHTRRHKRTRRHRRHMKGGGCGCGSGGISTLFN